MDLLTVDFETYYDKDYSLKKLTTEEYIRDSQFEVIGVAVKKNEEATLWASGSMTQLYAWLNANFDWKSSAVLCHNTLFDGAILSWVFDIQPLFLLDTLSMARALHGVEVGNSLKHLAERYGLGQKGTEVITALGRHRDEFTPEELSRYGDYCVNDVELTYELFKRLNETYPPKELRVIDITLRMFTQPKLQLDKAYLESHLQYLTEYKEQVLATCGVTKDILMSNNKFALALQELGVEPPLKISARTGKEAFAFGKTDDGFKALLDHEDERVQVLASARLGTKSTIEETRTQRLIDISARGLLPVPISYYAARTGRFGGADKINLQNLPKRGPHGNKIRRAIRPPDGYVLIDSDSSQIEARTVAWLAGEDWLLEAFAAKDDVYKRMASSIYGVPVEEVTKDQRFIGKTTVLGCGYGMGATKFRDQLRMAFGVSISEAEASTAVTLYRQQNANIVALWKAASMILPYLARQDYVEPFGKPGVIDLVPSEQGILLPNGMMIRYPNLRCKTTNGNTEYWYTPDANPYNKRKPVPNRIYGGKIVENVVQALARIVVTDQMVKISKRYQVVLTVHDALAIVVPEKEAQEAKQFMKEAMSWVPRWAEGLPVDCEVGMGYNYADTDK